MAMQAEILSLMQQLVTAVQSIALSVDVMSVDVRSLSKNVSQLLEKKDRELIPMQALAPECSYGKDDDASSQGIRAPAGEQASGIEATTSYQAPDFHGNEVDTQTFPGIRESLREDITKAIKKTRTSDVARWQKECVEVVNTGEVGWEGFCQVQMPTENDTKCNKDVPEMQPSAPEVQENRPQRGTGVIPLLGRPPMNRDGQKKEHRCVWCDKELSDKYKLKRHWRVHTGEKPFRCVQCGKAFRNKENLIVHARVHSGEKPFRCDVCGKMFAQNGQLTVHRRVHTGERPYQCDLCGKAFKDSAKLKRHQRVHVQ